MRESKKTEPLGPTGWEALKSVLWFVASPFTAAFLLVVAVASVPYRLVLYVFDRRSEQRFMEAMEAVGRRMPWLDFKRAVEDERGTVIREELRKVQGPVRWWWTPDNVEAIVMSPPEHELAPWQGEGWREYSQWCFERYTHPAAGSALLIWSSSLPRDDREMEEDEIETALPLVKMARIR